MYVFLNNNPIGNAELISGMDIETPNNSKMINFPLCFNITIPRISTGGSNYWNPHWENKWFDTDCPGFFVVSNEGLQVIN